MDGSVTSVDQIPENLREIFAENISSTNQDAAYQEWLENLRAEADIQINEMPADVPYNVNTTAASDEAGDSEGDEGDAAAE